MTSKEPVLLTVLINTEKLRWHVAGLRLDGTPIPLMRSEENNLDAYIGVPFDEQVSSGPDLDRRHRLPPGLAKRTSAAAFGGAAKKVKTGWGVRPNRYVYETP